MHHELEPLIDDFRNFASQNSDQRNITLERVRSLQDLLPREFAQLVRALAQLTPDELTSARELLHTWLRMLLHARRATRSLGSREWLESELPELISNLYRHLNTDSDSQGLLLGTLAAGGSEPELQQFVALLEHEPPREPAAVAQGFTPLFQFTDYRLEPLFPALLAALTKPELAAIVLDFANFLTRERKVQPHPAQPRRSELISLLDQLARRLQLLEEHPQRYASSPQALSETISHGVSLAVALCDALGLMPGADALEVLRAALLIRHRRVRTEAAAALARLGDEAGRTELLRLASEPVARLRVLHYAEELGLADQLEPEFQTAVARAEASLAVWLAEPTQFGIPPAECSLLDQRTLAWPGYDEPCECFLFTFRYRFQTEQGNLSYENVGIAGPLVKAITADLTKLPKEQVYALFAGWHVEHEDIFEVPAHLLTETQRVELLRLERRLRDAGHDDIRPLLLCYFLGEKSLIAEARQRGASGIALASAGDVTWFPRSGPRPLGPNEVLYLSRGWKILSEFNEI